jgi:hypothetical protein
MRGLRTDVSTGIVIAARFMQNIRRGHYELVVDGPKLRVAMAFDELTQAV